MSCEKTRNERARSMTVQTSKHRVTIIIENILVVPESGSVSGLTNAPLAYQVPASGGDTPLVFAVASESPNQVPAGLTLNPATGQISGVPTEAGTFVVEVDVTES